MRNERGVSTEEEGATAIELAFTFPVTSSRVALLNDLEKDGRVSSEDRNCPLLILTSLQNCPEGTLQQSKPSRQGARVTLIRSRLLNEVAMTINSTHMRLYTSQAQQRTAVKLKLGLTRQRSDTAK